MQFQIVQFQIVQFRIARCIFCTKMHAIRGLTYCSTYLQIKITIKQQKYDNIVVASENSIQIGIFLFVITTGK